MRFRPGAKGSRREAARISACDAGDLVEIRVADSGPGVSPEPPTGSSELFFTTKPAGEGTGIGLSIARRVVTRFGGSLELEQGAPGGATFVVRLPRIAPG